MLSLFSEKKQKIAIIGMGKSGEAALQLFLVQNYPRKQILTFDHKSSSADTQSFNYVLQWSPDILVVSPGVPLSTPWIQDLKKTGVKITSEISLACSFLNSEHIIGITGSLGKSTTVAALGAAAVAFDRFAFVGGNLGTPLSQYAVDLLTHKRPRAKVLVLELSSFQLENCEGLFVDEAVITFLSPNHLERYRDLQHYYETKWHLIEICKGPCFLNQLSGDLASFVSSHKKATSVRWVQPQSIDPKKFDFSKVHLIGPHNQQNLTLAWSITEYLQWPEACQKALYEFAGLEHRLQSLGEFHEILCVNDSKATALDSVLVAVDSCLKIPHKKTLHVLLGGRDKNLPWKDLALLQKNSRLHFYFFGECRLQAQAQSGLPGTSHVKLKSAVETALAAAKKGDILLLSPGGTSMDEFKNFEDRGNYFKKLIITTLNEPGSAGTT